MGFFPFPEAAYSFSETVSEFRNAVIDMGRDHGKDVAGDQSVAFQLAQSLGEHFLADVAHLLLDLGEAKLAILGEDLDDQQGPLVRNQIQKLPAEFPAGVFEDFGIGPLHSIHRVSIERKGAYLPLETMGLRMLRGGLKFLMTTAIQPVRKLGSQGPEVFPIALGCMGMSDFYGPSDEAESLATIHAAIDAGVNVIDTGDFYGMGHNEMLVGRAIQLQRDDVLVSVKFGAQRGPDGSWLGYDAQPAAVKTALAYSLKRLGVDHIDIYRPARLDPKVPIEDTVGAIADMIQAGYVRYVGLSEVGPETIRRAVAVHPVVDLQIEYSLMSRGPEAKIFPLLRELGIATTAYGVLSRGLLSNSKPTGAGDFRARLPRFTGDNLANNDRMVARLREIAGDKGITQVQLAIAWVLAKSDSIVPVIGARKRAQLAESLGALNVKLSADELAAIEAAVPAEAVAGSRYGEEQMHSLDSEK